MTPADLDAIEKRAAAATPGPWRECGDILQGKSAIRISSKDLFCSYDTMSMQNADDARFIAAARSDVPALLAEVRRLQAELSDNKTFIAAALSVVRSIDADMSTLGFRMTKLAAAIEACDLDPVAVAWDRHGNPMAWQQGDGDAD